MTAPFSLVGLDHLVLRVTDLEASLAFYRDLLGCTLERELPDIGLYQLRAGKHLIDLVPTGTPLGGDSAPSPESPNQDHFCLQIDPFDEASLTEYLQARQLDISEVASRYGADGHGPSLYIQDPDGNTIELKAAP